MRAASQQSMPRIEEICRTYSGGTPDRDHPEYFGGGIPWVKSGEVVGVITETEETLSDEGLRSSSAKWVERGALLMAMYGAGLTAGQVARLDIRATTNQAVLAIVPNQPEEADYLGYAIAAVVPSLLRRKQGSGQPNLNAEIIRRARVPWPDDRTRRSVERAMRGLDGLGHVLGQLTDAKRSFKRGLMQQLLTGRKRFPEFRDRLWVRRSFSDYFVEKSIANTDRTVDLVYSCTKIAGIVPQAERFGKRLASKDLARYKVVEPGDLVYDPMLLWDGSIGFVPANGRGVVSPAYETFKVNESANREYFGPLLKSYNLIHRYKQISQGTNTRRRKAHPSDFLKTVVQMPPTKSEQDKIANVLSTAQREIDLLTAKREKLEVFRRALLSRLLSGSLPVPS